MASSTGIVVGNGIGSLGFQFSGHSLRTRRSRCAAPPRRKEIAVQGEVTAPIAALRTSNKYWYLAIFVLKQN